MPIKIASNLDEIRACFPLISELRPHLSENAFMESVQRLNEKYQYNLVFIDEAGIKVLAGIRESEWLHTGKYMEIEELITEAAERSKGYGSMLFDWICEYAKERGCQQVRLVSGVAREDAHRFYLRKGMRHEAKYFSINLNV